ncbi:hypothetical protein [uncultured Helicobacter sp.]|uniref:hypothetical protein n=1 Tax=uncultured Helicobacter sp. TaxID=175537 RepID=UPI00374F9A08
MKKITILVALISIPSIMLGNCDALMQKYNAPDPASKTMSQISRWVSSKVEDSNDAKTLESCMIARAADNPNKEQVAGK